MTDDDADKIIQLYTTPKQEAEDIPLPSRPFPKEKQLYTPQFFRARVDTFVVWCWSTGLRHRFAYGMGADTDLNILNPDLLIITLPRVVLHLHGRNLDIVDDAIGLRSCVGIVEYSPQRHLPPTDDSAAFIERIEVIKAAPPKKPELVKPQRVAFVEPQGGVQ